MLQRVLIANRGEIARRIIRTCRRLGITTIAVYSDADAGEPHVLEADQAVHLGPPPATDSYLAIDRVVAAARQAGADAVHPGYGFLAENARFAEAVLDAGLAFVGPSPDVIRLMGDKAAAKQRLAAAGIPVVPGVDDPGLDDSALVAAAAEIGTPLLVKAVAGGGGKGMRAVHHLEALADAIAAARREAAAAFGDDRLILERLVSRPRHVEVQVLGDTHGRVLHLFERECSVQRRHQKVVEESPSPALDAALRARMCDAAVRVAEEVGYVGAGTVEFLVAGDTLGSDRPEFHFLEMNTRLQVEHPVTELVTGLDLVELQLGVATGAPLPVTQDEVASHGHAIEVRLYAEDPVSSLPQTGTVHRIHVPEAEGVRVDSGIEPGSLVTRHYDPMLAKLVVHGPDRPAACQRMSWLLERVSVHGVVTNLDQLAAIVAQPAFLTGELTTAFIDEHLGDWTPPPAPTVALLAAVVALQHGREHRVRPGDPVSPWDRLGPFRPGLVGGWHVRLDDGVAARTLTVAGRGGSYRVILDDAHHVVTVTGGPDPAGWLHLDVDGREEAALVSVVGERSSSGVAAGGGDASPEVWVHAGGVTRRLAVLPATRHADSRALATAGAATSPMPGAVLAVPVQVGVRVEAGATLAVVEAMKMEHPVVASGPGTVRAVHVAPGDAVEAGTPLVEVEPDGAGTGDEVEILDPLVLEAPAEG